MSYYNGIPDKDLIEEGWTKDQITELRRLEDNIRARRKKEWDDEQKKWRQQWEDLGPFGQKAFSELWMAGMPEQLVLDQARRLGKIREQRDIERQIRLAERKWWQFWIK